MLVQYKIQRRAIIDDDIIGGEVGFGNMTAVRPAEYEDFVVAS